LLSVTEELCSEPSRPPESRHLSLPAWCWPPIVARKPWAVSIEDQRFHWLIGMFQLRGKAAVMFSTKLRLAEMLMPTHVDFTFCDACSQRMTVILPTVLEQSGNKLLVRRCQSQSVRRVVENEFILQCHVSHHILQSILSSHQRNKPCFHTDMSTKLHGLTAFTRCVGGALGSCKPGGSSKPLLGGVRMHAGSCPSLPGVTRLRLMG
jgi:hypothetical protein